jgi:hypothetical protein
MSTKRLGRPPRPQYDITLWCRRCQTIIETISSVDETTLDRLVTPRIAEHTRKVHPPGSGKALKALGQKSPHEEGRQ